MSGVKHAERPEALRRFKPYAAYKDSGVEWLGEIPADWEVKPFKALLSRNDSGVWGEDSPDDGTIVLRSTEQSVNGEWSIEAPARRLLTAREAAQARLKVGDLVVTKSSGSDLHIGKTSIVDHSVAELRCGFSNFMQRLRVDKQHEARFFWYLMNAPVAREQFVFLSSTTTGLGNLNGSILGAIRVPAVPPAEQRAIAAFLDRETARIDALVAKKERLIELLQEQRTALITRVVTKGLDPNAPMKDSGVEWLGEIPAHWEVKALKRVVVNLDSRRVPLSGEERATMAKEYPYYGASGVIDRVEGYLFDEPLILVAEDGANLYSRSTPLAFVAEGKYWVNNHAHILRPHDGKVHYWAHVIGRIEFDPWISGSAQPKLTSEKLGSIPLPVPPAPEREDVLAVANVCAGEINRLSTKVREAIDRLKELRTALISAAVTGKIDVREEVA